MQPNSFYHAMSPNSFYHALPPIGGGLGSMGLLLALLVAAVLVFAVAVHRSRVRARG